MRKDPALDLDTSPLHREAGGPRAHGRQPVPERRAAAAPPSGQSRGVFLPKPKHSHKRRASKPIRIGFSTTGISFTCSCSGGKQRLPDLHSHTCLAAESAATSSSISGPSEPPSPPPTHVPSVSHFLRLIYIRCVFLFTSWSIVNSELPALCLGPPGAARRRASQPQRSLPKPGKARALRLVGAAQNPREELQTFSCTAVCHTDMITLHVC